jgi:1-acyl-sn-glycerol-3-phosphate acyltransferase
MLFAVALHTAIAQKMIQLSKRFLLVLYGIYAWTTFLVLGLVTLLLLMVAPGLTTRRVVGSQCARLWLRVVGITVEFRGADRLPTSPAVIVANHSSYVDGVVLKAVLPTRYAFVIKKEMIKVPLAGLLLRRIGAEFVDRFNRHSGGMDARRLMRTASGGSSLVFFPEGTFTGRPGLARFHGGAFTIAARARMPVVPVVIRGARHVLRGGTIWPRPGRVEIEVLTTVDPHEKNEPSNQANILRDQCRAHILLALGEPDLAENDGIAELAAERKSQRTQKSAAKPE